MSALRHNVLTLGADYALFMVGLSFASQSTLLPAFAAWLGAPNVVIGAIPAVMTVGWWLPSLFAAGHTQALSRKLPFVLRYTLAERVPFVVLALAAFFTADRWPGLTLLLMLAMLVVVTGVGGVLMPAWMDIVGRAIPVTLRGRFFAISNLLASAAGFAGSFLTAHVLATVAAPAAYGWVFVAAAACMGLSFVALVLVREPPAAGPVPAAVPLRAYLARVPALLRANPNLAWFLGARGLTLVGAMANGFFTVYALRTWNAPASQVGVFTTMYLAGQMAGNVVFGWLADRAGHRVVLMAGMVATLAGNVIAVAAPSLGLFHVVFVLVGINFAAVSVSGMNVLLEFAPAPHEQPTYIGLGTTSMAPIAFGAPLLGGVVADTLGFAAVFALAALGAALALGVMALRVRDPRAGAPLASAATMAS